MTKNQLLRLVAKKYAKQKELAQAIGVASGTVSRWLRNKLDIDKMESTTVIKLCELAGVNPNEITDTRIALEDALYAMRDEIAYLKRRCQDLEQSLAEHKYGGAGASHKTSTSADDGAVTVPERRRATEGRR